MSLCCLVTSFFFKEIHVSLKFSLSENEPWALMTRMRRLAAQLSIPQARFRDVLYGCPREMNVNDNVGRIFLLDGSFSSRFYTLHCFGLGVAFLTCLSWWSCQNSSTAESTLSEVVLLQLYRRFAFVLDSLGIHVESLEHKFDIILMSSAAIMGWIDWPYNLNFLPTLNLWTDQEMLIIEGLPRKRKQEKARLHLL